MAEKWIQNMHMKKGALHRSLGVKEGQKIPESKLKKAEHSKNPTTARRARLAETLKSFHHKPKEEKMDREEKYEHKDKKEHKGIMKALKKHFKEDEKHEEKEEKSYKSKNMDKDARKKMAVMIMKKKMA